MNNSNKQVHELAKLTGRTSGAIVRRLANFASLDPVQQARGIKGLANAGGLAEIVWKEFYDNWDEMFEQSELLLAKYKNIEVEKLYDIDWSDLEDGINKERIVKTRLNQYRFRQLVMTNYNGTCCITGIKQPALLVASHITSWSKYENNRLNPANGLCLNALHDKAFDNGLLSIDATSYRVILSSSLKQSLGKENEEFFIPYEGREIFMPKKFLPDPDFLTIHNNTLVP